MLRIVLLYCLDACSVTNFMQGGDLRKALWQDGKDGTHIFDWDNKGKHVALAVARGLHFLHENDVIHRYWGCLTAVMARVHWQA